MRFHLYSLILSTLAFIGGPLHAYSQGNLWVASESGKAYTLELGQMVQYDFQRGKKSINRQSLWIEVDSFATLPQLDALYKFGSPYVFTLGDSIVFTFSGSGVVFGKGPGKLPQRVDNTYYSGYNYECFRALHEGVLYSFGGSGFWARSPALIYFDQDLKEWERLSSFANQPEFFAMLWAAEKSPGVYISSSFPDKDWPTNTTNREVYQFDFPNRTSQFMGYMTFDLDEAPHEYNFIGHIGPYFLLQIDQRLHIGDVAQNKMYLVHDLLVGTASYNGYQGIFIADQQIVHVHSASTMSNPSIHITTLSIDELLARSIDLDKPVYISRIQYIIRKYTTEFLTILIAILFIVAFLVRYNLSQPGVEKAFVESLSDSERRLLRFLILLPDSETATIHDIDALLNTADKSWENQRKIRSKSFQSLNEKALKFLGYMDFIQRIPNPDDKRERTYQLSPEHKANAASFLRHF